ncbi:uncharacterized protein [Bombus fervidus]|uniref:uncharacterized protein n=1 Tax=Bombus fervidus TaxID=203811 RepID=UPI003AB5607D
MRALNSRRLQPTRTFHLFPPSFLCLLFLLFVLRVVQPRSVPHDEQNQARPAAKLSPGAKKHDFGEINSTVIDEVKSEESKENVEEISKFFEQLVIKCPSDDFVVSKEESRKKRENQRTKKVVDVVGASDEGSSEVLKQEDEEAGVVKKRRRNDVALVGKSEVRESEGIPVGQIGEATDEGIRRFDSQVDADGVAPDPIDARRNNEEYKGSVKAIEPKKSEISNAEESRVQDDEKSKHALPNYFRKSGKLEDDDSANEEEYSSDESADSEEIKEFFANREYRSFVEPRGKSKRKSSTVYLNAEEKKISDGEQQSIVDGQIKKLISIRDDALDARKTDKIDEAKVFNSKRQVGTDEWLAFNEEKVRNANKGNKQKSGRVEDLHRVRLLTPDVAVYNILQDALESYPNDETLVSYIDPKNDTLKELLTFDQLTILQMAEKFLPQALRREYSDKMFSCVRRFEYFSCVKYFAWPLVKQYFPALPAFPDYQCWYPIADLSPQYPIFPFPSFSEDIGELPEVVDADGTRTRKPRPEALIIQVLQNTLKEQPRISTSPSFLDQSMDTYITLIPEDQLLTINMAEQLIPISYRPEFVQKTVRCMKEYNYLSCFKYSAWPTVKRFIPTLPDIFSLLPEFQGAGLSSDVGSYVPQLSAYSNLNFYVPVGATTVPKDTETPAYSSLKNRGTLLRSSDQLETKILEILQKNSNDFIDAARYVIWPTIAKYQPTLAEFPQSDVTDRVKERLDPQGSSEIEESSINPAVLIQERVVSNVEREKAADIFFGDKESRNRVPNVPVISVSGTRFVPIFSELPESVIYNILRSVQLQSIKSTSTTSSFTTKNQEFLDLLTVQQANIIGIVDTLLPENVRPEFVNTMLSCLRTDNFLMCTRDVVWPTLSVYFPWLPNFPDFGIVSSVRPSDSPSAVPNTTLTESSSSSDTPALSETDVKTGQHGDTTVTITDTRFFPIYNELPETIISNILKAVQFSIPNLPGSPAPVRTQEFSPHLSEHQINIINIAENLLPIPTRLEYIENIKPCIKERNFLECSRDVTWPTIAKFYPWLPSFPNFGTLQNLPDESSSSSIDFQVVLSEKPPSPAVQASQVGSIKEAELLEQAEEKIENILSDILGKSPELKRSYLNLTDSVASSLNKRQINIIRLVERGLPDTARQSYVARMQNCITGYNFVACTNNIIWPILKQYSFSLPDFSSISDLFSQFPGIVQIPGLPDFGSIAGNIPGISQLPGILQIPGISQLSTEFPTLSTQPGELAARSGSQNSQSNSHAEAQDDKSKGDPTITPSVDNDGAVPGYANQPPGILIDISNEKVDDLPDTGRKAATIDSKSSEEVKSRQRRSTIDVLGSYYDNEEADTADGLASSKSSTLALPNITESEYLRLLIRVKENLRSSNASPSKSEQYLVDKLNSTMRNSLTADQYEILKIIQDLEDRPSSKGITQQVIQCILSLSFIRCLGIFVWPLVVSNLPSLPGLPGLPGLPSLPSFGILGRYLDTDSQVRNFFGVSTTDFEQRLLERKESIESFLLDWYRKLAEDKFQTDVGYLKIKGYGNNQLGISFSGFREGRGAKLKDNKNLPSILTIISDIMEEVLDQRPEGDRAKKDKEKRERSIEDSRETDIQFLKNSEEMVDIERSINDDEIITLFLDRIRPNDSEIENDDTKYTSDDAYDAFGVLFGTKLHDELAGEIESLDAEFKMEKGENGPIEPTRQVDIVSLESGKDSDELKVLPTKSQVAYDFEKESSRDQDERQRQKRAKNFFKSFLEKYSDRRSKDGSNVVESFDNVGDNKIVEEYEKDAKSTLVVQLPRLHEEVVSRKVTNSMIHMGKAFKTKMTQMMPGFGLVLSFLLQMVLAHARATASMAGMISNMALGTAMFGMIRDSFFGSSGHPKIKYVYDNDKNGPGISWPAQYESGSRYYG